MQKLRVIIKRPDEAYGHVTYISDTLKNLQSIVGGNIEVVETGFKNAVIICNEEGRLLGLKKNILFGITFPQAIMGTIIVCGVDGENFADVPFGFASWKVVLKAWGN